MTDGSEHTVDGHAAALEVTHHTTVDCIFTVFTFQVQLLGYNGQLYGEEEVAIKSPNGGVGIAVLAQVGEGSVRGVVLFIF